MYLAVARGPSGFNKLVVLKSLRSSFAEAPDLLRMFLEEARLAARLNHPHVVQTYEVGEYLDRPVIVMEYLEGQTFANVDSRGRDRLSLALRLRVILDALEENCTMRTSSPTTQELRLASYTVTSRHRTCSSRSTAR